MTNPRRGWLGALLLALLWVETARVGAADAERGRPFLQSFGLRDYHAHNQVWAAAQDARGVLYFGNKSAVLEYDGVSWRKLPLPQTTFVRGLAHDPASGRIYLGAVDELGYLELAPDGTRAFVSLLDQLPADTRDFRDIRRVHAPAAGEIVFAADRQVMRWRGGRFTVWRPGGAAPLTSFLVDGRVFIHSRDVGLRRLDGEAWTPVAPDAAVLRENPVTLLVAGAAPGELLAGTPEQGLWTVAADGRAAAFPTDADGFLRRNKVRRGRRLPDGTLALATANAGLVWLAADGRFLGRVDESAGLPHDTILDLFSDREGGLWLGLNSGLARVELGAGLTVFDAANGLKHATVRALARVDGALWLAAGSGLYRLAPADSGAARPARGERLAEGEFWSVCPDGAGGGLAGGVEGVWQWGADGGAPARVFGPELAPMILRPSRRDPARVWVGSANGLSSLRREGVGWRDEGAVPGLAEEVRTVAEAADGAVWVGTPQRGVFRVAFTDDGGGDSGKRGTATVQSYFKTHGLPEDMRWTRALPWRGGADVLFATQAGLFRHDPAADRFLPVLDYGARFGDGAFMLGNVAEDAAGGLWLAGRSPGGVWLDQELGRAAPGGAWQALPARVADKVGEIEGFLPEVGPDGAGVVWVTGTDGLARVEVGPGGRIAAAAGGAAPAFGALVRGASTLRGPPGLLPAAGGATLPAARNSVRFAFAADSFRFGAGLRYQTRLEGLPPGGWSEASARTSADYTNLPAGGYTFRVRALDADGRMSREAAYRFRVLPPWTQTAWARAGYALLGALAVAGLVRWRLARFRQANRRLEARVARQTGELVRARDAAEGANRAKSAFLANMSHELRTPLNAVLGYTRILLKDRAVSDANRERLGVVERSGEHLLGMINEVLDLAKIEAGKLPLDPTDFPLERLLEAAAEAFRPRAAEKGIAFTLTRGPGLPAAVHGDEARLRQVLFNLLGNAVKFTARGGVELAVARAGDGPDRLRFEVRDTGIGIAAGELENIFLAFHQAPGAGAALAAQGTGLGLAISQRLAALLGGELGVASAPGEGSRFWFEASLPTAAFPQTAAQSLPPPPGGAVSGYEGPRRRLLAVDDEEVNRRILRELLAPLGFEVEECPGGTECLARCARAPRPDAVLLDLRMPGTDGFATARALRRAAGGACLKIIAVSASVFESDRQQALDAGCDGFLPKPFDEGALLAALGRALALKWVSAAVEPPATGPASQNGASAYRPPPEEMDALLELARRGDVLRIRRRLADLLASNPHAAGFVKPLESLAAGYQMNRLREALLASQPNG